MSTPTGHPGADALALIEKADGALSVYKAIHTEFDGKDMPADKKAEADAAYADFEKHDDLARKATETLTRHQKGEDFAAYKARLAQSAGRIPVGGTPPMGVGGDEDTSIVYKARSGKAERFTPDKSVNGHWTAKAEREYTNAFRRWLGTGMDPRYTPDAELFVQKGLSVGKDVGGGFWVVPEVFSTEIIAALADEVMMRRLGTVMPAIPRGSSVSMGTDSGLGDAEWTSELSTATADTAEPAGRRRLTPHPLAKLVKASSTYLDSGPSGESYVRDQAKTKIGAAEESAFMIGSGAQKPEGIYVSSLPTDVTCAGANDIVYADLLNVEAALKSQYAPGASWIMHRTIRKELLSMVDGQGLPLLRRDPAAPGRMDLFQWPIELSEYSPSVSTTGLYVLALGNWKRCYRIVDSLDMRVKRLNEVFYATDEIGFDFRSETDGMVVDGNGLIRLKMA